MQCNHEVSEKAQNPFSSVDMMLHVPSRASHALIRR